MAPWTDTSFWFMNALIHGCQGRRPLGSFTGNGNSR